MHVSGVVQQVALSGFLGFWVQISLSGAVCWSKGLGLPGFEGGACWASELHGWRFRFHDFTFHLSLGCLLHPFSVCHVGA